MELLVVIGLVAGLSFFLLRGFSGPGAALQSGQAAVVNLLALARTHALASGNQTRVLVHHDRSGPAAAERYLRQLAVQELRGGSWQTLQMIQLPSGVHIVPHRNQSPAGLFAGEGPWLARDGTPLHSSCLERAPVSHAVNGPEAEMWVELIFTALGTTGNSGFLVLATGGPVAPDVGSGEPSPVQLRNPHAVRGVQLSGYGLSVLIDDYGGF